MSFCTEHKCAHCCVEADVPLLKEDIDRITSMGYFDVYFVVNDNGVQSMRKLDGKCIFFREGKCEIYERRPKRCRIFPMTFDGKNNCATIQDDCRFKQMYEITLNGNEEMLNYVDRLRHEYELRNHHKSHR